ncbi:MAG: hypothetical protein ACOY3K_04945 [Candidatus Omnitrophota bacterium]
MQTQFLYHAVTRVRLPMISITAAKWAVSCPQGKKPHRVAGRRGNEIL